MKLAIILTTEYRIFALKINCGSQQQTYQVEADQQSRILQDATEWKLHLETVEMLKLFHEIVDKFGKQA